MMDAPGNSPHPGSRSGSNPRQGMCDAPVDYKGRCPVYAYKGQPEMTSDSKAWRMYLSEAAIFDEVLEEYKDTADSLLVFTTLLPLIHEIECDETMAPYMLSDSETADEEASFSWECFHTTPSPSPTTRTTNCLH